VWRRPSSYPDSSRSTYDYENFLCGVFLPKPVRESVYALRAFNVELARVRESVKNPEIGKMRFQFFRDQLDSIFKKQPVQSPLARALASAVYEHGLSRLFLERLITHRVRAVCRRVLPLIPFFYYDSQEADLEARQPASLEDMEKYAEGTASTLLYLSLKCAGIDDVEADHAASHIGATQLYRSVDFGCVTSSFFFVQNHLLCSLLGCNTDDVGRVGKAQGLLTVLRAAPFHAANRRIYLPYNLCVQV